MQSRDGRFVAISLEPWLEIVLPSVGALAARFVELTYRASFWDEPVRPVFRFRLDGGDRVDRIAAGPIVGAGIWIGRVPAGTRRIEVSPTNRLGRFDFRIERIRPLPWLSLVARGLRTRPRRTRSALLTRLIGWKPESDVNLSWATGALPLTSFSSWHRKRTRPLDLAGLDAPRFDWSSGPPIRVVIAAGDPEDVNRSLASLSKQVFPRWLAVVPASSGITADDPRVCARADPGLSGSSKCGGDFEDPDTPDGMLTCWIEAGDVLVPGALGCLAEQAHRHPSCGLFYADAMLTGMRGMTAPCLHPGWSPRLFAERPPRKTLIAVRDLKLWSREERERFFREGWVPALLDPASDGLPLRRMLLEARQKAAPVVLAPARPRGQAKASVIIPTRDHPALLRRAIESIRKNSSPKPPQIVVVDNGSTTDAARRLLAELARGPGIVCLPQPGQFNFSQMCNEGAAAANGDVLVFLNDDTEILSAGWLDRLVSLAIEPAVGAVGARMSYPDGRLQHVGVLLGMGESAGHFGALAPPDDPGWASRNMAVHEVSAVTGACLAVARKKFEAVGGFDAQHLPVELSDIDLCLKLNARGWQTVVDPAVHLLHEESASRGGATFRRLGVYASQRAVFVERWRHVLRDDPFFHPGLSLYSFEPALA